MTFLSSTDLWDLSPDGFLLADSNGTVCAANEALSAMFDREAWGLVGTPVERLVPDDLQDTHVALRNGYFEEPESKTMGNARSLLARDLAGRTFPVTVSLTPLTIDGELFIFAAVRDLSERLKNQLSLEEADRRREKAEEVERIATELHDNVIQRLFVLGLDLAQVTPLIGDADAEARLSDAIDTIDSTIREIRNTIFDLTSPRPPSIGLRDQVQEIAAQLERQRGIAPAVSFLGDLDQIDPATCGAPVQTFLHRTIDLLAPDPADGSLSIRLEAGDALLIEVNATGADRPSGPLLAELHRLRADHAPAALELDHDDGTTTVQWTVALAP